MNDRPSRRGLRFSLRVLLLAVTCVCLWLGWEVNQIQARRALRRGAAADGFQFDAPDKDKPSRSFAARTKVRRWLGDESVEAVWYHREQAAPERLAQLKRAFPEAEFREIPALPCHPGCFPAGTLVATPAGPRPIETVVAGDTLTVIAADRSTVGRVQTVFVTSNRLWQIDTTTGAVLTTQTQPLLLTNGDLKAAGELQPGDQLRRWIDDKPAEGEVLRVLPTQRSVRVYNVILGESEVFVADGFLARSKPPADDKHP